ncbi:reprolysin-like metallopeptidase [Chryseobacterium kwangjuense]|uniref:Reprolysin-like metallopeptidase n=1 Tax=Chryseobacterium kwangjuense TaxID=267125 RepID=A0ABW9K3D6_9FLAO
MKKLFYFFLLLVLHNTALSQYIEQNYPAENHFFFEFKKFKNQFSKRGDQKEKLSGKIELPLPGYGVTTFILTENTITEKRLAHILTFDGVTRNQKLSLKLTLLENSFNAAVRSDDGTYYFIESINIPGNYYKLYSFDEAMRLEQFKCFNTEDLNLKIYPTESKSVNNFPVGNQIKKYRLAVAATGESAQELGSSDAVLSQIITNFNAVNLIYESELSVSFTIISETIDKVILFDDPTTDPFSGTGAGASQTGFNAMNASGLLTYDKYDVGHTVNIHTSTGTSGTAGGQPCNNTSKASGFSRIGTQNSLGLISGLITHEMGHQFGASHSYNATGGDSPGNTFCASGWSSQAAVEPGSGSTLMAYGTNCGFPVDQRYSSGNRLSPFFHAKSLDQILMNIQNSSTCYSTLVSSNSIPVANAGADITIPKNTPFRLKGIGNDNNNTNLSFTWEQIDVATTADKGAFGSTLNGDGGYSAVNSMSAPLFRSVQSTISGERYFPKMDFVLYNQNNPPMNEGEV